MCYNMLFANRLPKKKKTCRKTDDSLIILLSNVCKYNLFNTENYEKFDYVKEYV